MTSNRSCVAPLVVALALLESCAREAPGPVARETQTVGPTAVPPQSTTPTTDPDAFEMPPDLPRSALEAREGSEGWGPTDLTPCCPEPGLPDWAKDPWLASRSVRCSMICMPSFSPSYVLLLGCEDGSNDHANERHPTTRNWFVFTAKCPSEKPRSRKNAVGAEGPRNSHVQIDEHSATTICDAWELVVRRTRYPKPRVVSADGERMEEHSVQVDGTSYHFGFGTYRGDTVNPQTELPAGLVGLGDALRALATADEPARPARLARCLELAQKLKDAAEQRPW